MKEQQTHDRDMSGLSNGSGVLGGGYRLSVARIVVLSIVSLGFYWYYWLCLTWVHYRDHHHPEARPVWRMMSYLVPVYGVFRVHAHLKAYRDLAEEAGFPDSISVGAFPGNSSGCKFIAGGLGLNRPCSGNDECSRLLHTGPVGEGMLGALIRVSVS